jgi:hypothetical protein
LTKPVKAIFLGEYNIDWNCQAKSQGNYIGAVYNAVMLMQVLNGSPVPFWAGIWDTFGDGTCGITQGTTPYIMPGGYLVAKGVRTIYGTRWRVPINTPRFYTCAVTPSPGQFGLMLVNAGNGLQLNKTVALSHWPVNSTGNGTVEVWQLSRSVPNGSTSMVEVTAGVTAALNFPDPSVTIIISGSR